ncbi:MAG: GTPase, partial [Scytonema sp. PMC 1070.18]|nr:GTPase [Scytonema sp. PMC 1070.18]
MFNSNDEQQAKDFLNNLKEKLQSNLKRKCVFLLVGRTGVGKSSTVNSLLGQNIAVVGDYEPTTMEIQQYDSEINGVKVTVVDTPGLCDELEEVGNDYKYLELMRSCVNEVDSMWFVSRLDDKRVTNDEKRGIKLISESFTPKIWQYTVIVFTFADALNDSQYSIALEKRTELIRNEIAKYTGVEIAKNVPSVAVSNICETTPDGKKWLGELYTQVYLRMSNNGAAQFFMATLERIKPPEKEKEIVYVP